MAPIGAHSLGNGSHDGLERLEVGVSVARDREGFHEVQVVCMRRWLLRLCGLLGKSLLAASQVQPTLLDLSLRPLPRPICSGTHRVRDAVYPTLWRARGLGQQRERGE